MLPQVSEGQQHRFAQDHGPGRRSSQVTDGLGEQAEASSFCILEEQVGLGVLEGRQQSPGAGRDMGQSGLGAAEAAQLAPTPSTSPLPEWHR